MRCKPLSLVLPQDIVPGGQARRTSHHQATHIQAQTYQEPDIPEATSFEDVEMHGSQRRSFTDFVGASLVNPPSGSTCKWSTECVQLFDASDIPVPASACIATPPGEVCSLSAIATGNCNIPTGGTCQFPFTKNGEDPSNQLLTVRLIDDHGRDGAQQMHNGNHS